MEIRELRRGNYVWYKRYVREIQDIFGDKVRLKDGEQFIHIKELDAIKLNEGNLLELGLTERYVKGEWSWADCKKVGSWGSSTEIRNTKNSGATTGYIYNRDYPEIFYVHQLQNIYFSRTYEELTIK